MISSSRIKVLIVCATIALSVNASAEIPATVLTLPLEIPSNSQSAPSEHYNLVLYLIPSEDFPSVIERAVIERETNLEIDSESEELLPSYVVVTQKEVQEISELQGQPFTQHN